MRQTVNVIEQFYQRIQPTDNQLVRKEMTMFFLDEKHFLYWKDCMSYVAILVLILVVLSGGISLKYMKKN